jgi:seryl-tRNA synthetase
MLDIKFIREHAGEVRIAITNKGIDLNLDELLAADMERSAALRAIEDLNGAKNKLNDEMKAAKTDDGRKEIIMKGKEVKERLAALEPKFKTTDAKFT